MPTIEKHLKVKTFTTPEGIPTCATDIHTGEFCQFYGTSHFGTRDECLATGRQISRVSQGGFTIPVGNCPMKEAAEVGFRDDRDSAIEKWNTRSNAEVTGRPPGRTEKE